MIVDSKGNPFPTGPQTAHVAPIASAWAEHPTRGLTPARLAQIMEAAERGDTRAQSELWADVMERDAHLCSELSKRRGAVSSLPWSIEPPDDASEAEQEAARRIESRIKSMRVRQLLFDLGDAIGAGYACVEMHPWVLSGGLWAPTQFKYREQRFFKLVQEGIDWDLRLDDGTLEGQRLWPNCWIVHHSAARSGPLSRIARMRSLVWMFLLKTFSVGDWAEFLEVYGYPVRIGKYGPNATKDEKATLMRAVVDIGRRAGGIMPDSMTMDLVDAVDGSPDAFSKLIEYCEKTQSKMVNGSTLTTGADGKSSTNALGQVHEGGRMEIRNADALDDADTLTDQLVWPIARLNGLALSRDRSPRWVFDLEEAEDLTLYAEALPKLAQSGMRIGVDWAHERLRIPKADPDQVVLTGAPVTPVSDPTPAVDSAPTAPRAVKGVLNAVKRGSVSAAWALGRSPAEIAAAAGGLDVEELVDEIAEEAADAHRDIVEALREMVEREQSLESLRESLLAAYGNLPMERLRAVMETGFALASLRGMLDVRDEAGLDG